MNDRYNRIAGSYDFLFSSALRQLRQDIRTYVFHKNYRRVVDICCGTGEQLRYLTRPDMQLCGIDSSLAMLERARTVCPDEIDLHLLDAEQDAFSPNSFDCVILSLVLHERHPSSARTIYENCQKLLRDQGALIIADFNPPPAGFFGSFIGTFLIPLIERCAGGEHYQNYKLWIENGGLEHFINRYNVSAEIISQPLQNNLLCCAVINNESMKTAQYNFGLLDLDLKQHLTKKTKSPQNVHG